MDRTLEVSHGRQRSWAGMWARLRSWASRWATSTTYCTGWCCASGTAAAAGFAMPSLSSPQFRSELDSAKFLTKHKNRVLLSQIMAWELSRVISSFVRQLL